MMPGISRKELDIISVVPDTDTDTNISPNLYHFTLDFLSYSLPYPVTSLLDVGLLRRTPSKPAHDYPDAADESHVPLS